MIKRFLHYLICALTCLISLNMYSQCTPGVMVNQTYFACDGQTAVAATLSDPVTLDPGCVSAFYITNPNDPNAMPICDADGSFTFSDYSFAANTGYQIRSIVGMDTNGDGCPDTNTDLSTSFTQIYFFEPISFDTTSTCNGGVLEHCVTASGGGYPACFPDQNSGFTLTTNLGGVVPISLGQTICYTSTNNLELTGMIEDDSGCTSDQFTTDTAPCVCDVGNLSVIVPNACLAPGAPAIATASVSNSNLNAGDVITYAIHTLPNPAVPGSIFLPNNSGQFNCTGCLNPCTDYYITAYAGTPGANGMVGATNYCDAETFGPFSYETAPNSPTIDPGNSNLTICVDDPNATVDVTVSGAGNGSWVITNSNGDILGTPPSGLGLSFFGATPGNCNVYYVNSGCASMVPSAGNINNLSGCFAVSNAVTVIRTPFLDSPGIMPNALILTCNGDDPIVQATVIPGSGTGTQTYVLSSNPAPNLGQIYTSNSTGQFDLEMWLPVGTEGYISATVGTPGGCYAVSNESTPVIYYDEIDITASVQCSNGVNNVVVSLTGGSPAADPNSTFELNVFSGGTFMGGTLSGGTMVGGATAIPAGQGGLVITDSNGDPVELVCNGDYTIIATCCNDACVDTVSFTAPCLDMVGTMPSANIITCDNYAPIVSTSIIPGTGMGMQTYILHSGDPSNPIAFNTSGQFDLDNYNVDPGEVVFISAAANFGDPCVEYSMTAQQAVYYPPMIVEVSTYCDANGNICADLTVTGGAPSVLNTLEYNVSFGPTSSGNFTPNMQGGLSLTDCGFNPGQNITATVSCCNNACVATDSEVAPNIFYNGSLCTDDFHVTVDSSVVCNASGFGNGGVLNYYLSTSNPGGSGSILMSDIVAGPQPTGDFSSAGLQLNACEEYHIFAVYGEDMNNNGIVDDPNAACNVFLDGPSVTYYVPVNIFPMVTCVPDNPGYYQVEYYVYGGSVLCAADTTCDSADELYNMTDAMGNPYTVCSGVVNTLVNPATGSTEFELGVDNYTICAEDANGFDMCIVSPIVTSCSTLPIELISYTGSIEDEGNLLTWVTGTELNSDYFTILKSNDGVEFTEIGTVAAAGISTNELEYTLLDNDFDNLMGTKYYKLVQADIDGRVEEVGIVQLTRGDGPTVFNSLNIVQMAPVPAVDILSVTIEANEGETTVSIYEMSGRIAYLKTLEATNGENLLDIEVSSFAAGAYILSVTNNNETVSERFIKE